MKHALGKFAMELAYTWKEGAMDNKKIVHGMFGLPIHLRMAHNWKMAPGVTFDSVQSLGKELKSRDKVDFQVTDTVKVSIAGDSDLRKYAEPSSMLKRAAVNLEIKL